MKLIKSIVRPNKVDDVREALERLNIAGMTVTDVRGHGRQKGHTAVYRGKEYAVTLLPKVEIEVVVANDVVEEAIKAVIEAARTGEIGDGRVFVLPVDAGYNIRTGERDVVLLAHGAGRIPDGVAWARRLSAGLDAGFRTETSLRSFMSLFPPSLF